MAGVLAPRWRERTLPQIVDDLARDKPNYAYGCWLVDHNSSSASVHTITYAQLCNVVNRLAWWLIEQLGRDRQGEVLTYVGPNDVRFTALVLATIKTGFKVSERHRVHCLCTSSVVLAALSYLAAQQSGGSPQVV